MISSGLVGKENHRPTWADSSVGYSKTWPSSPSPTSSSQGKQTNEDFFLLSSPESFHLTETRLGSDKRLGVERVEDGVVVAGRVFPSSSSRYYHRRQGSVSSGLGGPRHQFSTLILLFAGCFVVVGTVLTVLAYRPLVIELSDHHSHHQLSGSYVAGPLVLVIGLLLLGVGLAFRLVSRRLDAVNGVVSDRGTFLMIKALCR